jgi:mRNA interferase RelE/StbE
MSRYIVFITPSALREIRDLPGHIKQRAKRAIDGLAENPRPSDSKQLDLPDEAFSVWRLRFDRWRVLYVITEDERTVDVLAVRRRPPYDYADLAQLLTDLN